METAPLCQEGEKVIEITLVSSQSGLGQCRINIISYLDQPKAE